MESNSQLAPVSKTRLWTGWIITGLVGLFLLFDAIVKLIMVKEVIEASVKLGYPENTMFGIGLVLLISTILYLVPKSAVLGAILLTAYLGGAVTNHVRVGDPFYFPIVMGILMWIGIYLREKRLHYIVPLRRNI
jgi:hypothetical protein